MNELTTVSGDEVSLSIGTLLANMEGGSFAGDFEGKVYKKALEMGVSLCRGPLGNLGCLLIGGGILEIAGVLQKGSISLCGCSVSGAPLGDPEGHGEEGSVDGHYSPVVWGSVHQER